MNKDEKKNKEKELQGYKPYPEDEDIYVKDKETDIDPEKAAENPGSESIESMKKENNVNSSLDVPGEELDDENEKKGAEDEENNYYSLGGDNHVDLEEDKGN
jgi:hypothetical protein